MNLLREYIRESLISERGDTDYKEQMVTDIAADVRIVNDAIESRHPAHAIPNSEHVEGSIGEALDLISLKKKYGRSRNEHIAQKLLDAWRTAMGAGGGKKGAAIGFLLAAGGAAAADHFFLGGALTYLGLGGAGLNTIYEVMAGNAADDDLKKYIQWDPAILEWMDDKKEDELEDEWIDLLFDHISKNPQDDLMTFISINDFANEKLGRPLKGEKIKVRINELREYIRELLSEEILTLHHRTSPDKAAIIRQAGFDSKIKTSFGTEVYFSTKPDGEATGYGSELVSIEIPEQYANLDDEFPDGEQHYWVTTKNLSQFGRLTEAPTLKHKGDENYFRVDLGRIGYAQGGTHLRFQDCQSDVDDLKQTPEYLEAEEKWMKNAKPRTDIVRDENGEWVMAETGESTPFTPKFYDVANAWIHDEGNRGKGHGKEIYKAFIDKASEYAKRNGGVFIGAHHCTLGSGTSEAAKRVWKSITKDYTSSGDVIFIGL
ncbi:MAG: hypothetical protein ABGX31_00430 [bacterium]|jgi:hypothetical protein